MKDFAADKIKNAFEDLIRDKKSLIKLLSIVLILLMAAVLKIHGSNNEKVTVENTETASAEETGGEYEDEASAEDQQILFVDISGAVVNPGVYQVASGTRLFEVVSMAGGLTDLADQNSINQASFVEDGQKIIIPSAGESGAAFAETVSGASAGDAAPAASAAADLSSLTLININIASKEELTTLNGIGDVIADRIIEYRSSNRFKSKEDIKSVKGIGDGIYDKIKDDITC